MSGDVVVEGLESEQRSGRRRTDGLWLLGRGPLGVEPVDHDHAVDGHVSCCRPAGVEGLRCDDAPEPEYLPEGEERKRCTLIVENSADLQVARALLEVAKRFSVELCRPRLEDRDKLIVMLGCLCDVDADDDEMAIHRFDTRLDAF